MPINSSKIFWCNLAVFLQKTSAAQRILVILVLLISVGIGRVHASTFYYPVPVYPNGASPKEQCDYSLNNLNQAFQSQYGPNSLYLSGFKKVGVLLPKDFRNWYKGYWLLGLTCSFSHTSTGEFFVDDSGVTIATCPYGGSLDDFYATNFCIEAPDCPPGEGRNPYTGVCSSTPASKPSEPAMCRASGELVGMPIIPATGEKFRSEIDWTDGGPSPLSLIRIYRSFWATAEEQNAGLGGVWTHNHDTHLSGAPSGSPAVVTISLPEGYSRIFTSAYPYGGPWTASNSADTLTKVDENTWRWRRADDDSTNNFTAQGKLKTRIEANGWTSTYVHNNAGKLVSVTNAFGRALQFSYNTVGQLTSVTTPDARVISYAYDSVGRLASVSYPDAKTRSFLYENTTYAQALTGISDESGARWGTFSYDNKGRAISTQLAGGANSYQVNYPAVNSVMVTDPLGTNRTYNYSRNFDKLAITSGSLPSGNSDSDAASRVQDVNGLITSETDFKGATNTTTWDVTRRLPLSVTYASGTPESRTVTTQWHPTLSVPALITETGRTTAYTYDAQGNVLSRAITDTNSNVTRTSSWTYNAQGLVANATAPNGAVTTYTYDTRGNVLSETNALGHVKSYAYDNANRLTTQTAPNGLTTAYTYDARDRLLTMTVGNQQTTTLTYNPTGTVATVALPTGLALTYSYDAAQRLTGWTNNRGESGSFTLDAMGNRTAEQINGSGGGLVWAMYRSINNINRVSARTEGSNLTEGFGFDANGDMVTRTNGLNQSTSYLIDGVRNIRWVTNAQNNTATLNYDQLGAVTSATDFNGVATFMNRDALGNATAESSGDRDYESTQYDALGLPEVIFDPVGQSTQIQRDVIGRPLSLVYSDGKTTTLSYDGAAVGKGFLSGFTDRSGTTTYTRDGFGRVTSKTQVLRNNSTQVVAYSYTAAGLIDTITYPTGSSGSSGALKHLYDTTGRLTQLNWNGAPLITGITWNALGQPLGWTWAMVSPSLQAVRSYDFAGRVVGTEFGSYVYDAAGRITSVTQQLFRPGDTNPQGTSIASASATSSIGYDAVGHLVSFANGSGASTNTASFSYDANGNRTASTTVQGSQSTGRTYTLVGSSNKHASFTQTFGGTSASVYYAYNAAGDLLSDGLRSYVYDAEGRLSSATTGATDSSPTTRYAHNALGQRVFKTEPQYPTVQGDESDPGFFQSLIDFFRRMWSPSTVGSEQLGYAFTYDEDGTLLTESGSGGAYSGGSAQYFYLPTASGPMPVAAVIAGNLHAVQSDHLNTPRRLTNASGQVVWQWAYSAFGEDAPTTAATRFTSPTTTPTTGSTSFSEVKFNLRYPGQYADAESGLNYNYFRSYNPNTGRYTQADPIGLTGGWNKFSYVDANPLKNSDRSGLCPMCLIPALPYVGEAAVVAAAWWASQNTFQEKTPNRGNPWEWHTNPGSGQERLYGADGRPAVDIDWDHEHGQGSPHPHNWGPNGREVPENGFSPWPKDRTNPAQCK